MISMEQKSVHLGENSSPKVGSDSPPKLGGVPCKGEGVCVTVGAADSVVLQTCGQTPSPLRATPPNLGGEFGGTAMTDSVSRKSKNLHESVGLRRELRTHGTPAEGALWKRLQKRQLAGLLFKRQFGVDQYILDFYCPSLRLAVELDGDYHHHVHQPEADFLRDKHLWEKHQIKVLRFENQLVFTSPKDIENAILFYAEERGVTL